MGISGVTILGLVESLSSIASAVTSACSSNVSYFVAMQLGQGNFKEAEKHAHALKGFHTLCGVTYYVRCYLWNCLYAFNHRRS